MSRGTSVTPDRRRAPPARRRRVRAGGHHRDRSRMTRGEMTRPPRAKDGGGGRHGWGRRTAAWCSWAPLAASCLRHRPGLDPADPCGQARRLARGGYRRDQDRGQHLDHRRADPRQDQEPRRPADRPRGARRSDLRALEGTKWFSDVQISFDEAPGGKGPILVIRVVEMPILRDVQYIGLIEGMGHVKKKGHRGGHRPQEGRPGRLEQGHCRPSTD